MLEWEGWATLWQFERAVAKLDPGTASASQMRDYADHEKDQENKEQNFGDACSCNCDSSKPENCGNDRYH
jgi:hypothetical protein